MYRRSQLCLALGDSLPRLGVNARCLHVFNYALSDLVHRHWLTFDTGAVVSSLAVWQFLD